MQSLWATDLLRYVRVNAGSSDAAAAHLLERRARAHDARTTTRAHDARTTRARPHAHIHGGETHTQNAVAQLLERRSPVHARTHTRMRARTHARTRAHTHRPCAVARLLEKRARARTFARTENRHAARARTIKGALAQRAPAADTANVGATRSACLFFNY